MKKFVFEVTPSRASFSKELRVALLSSKYIYSVVRDVNAASADLPGVAVN